MLKRSPEKLAICHLIPDRKGLQQMLYFLKLVYDRERRWIKLARWAKRNRTSGSRTQKEEEEEEDSGLFVIVTQNLTKKKNRYFYFVETKQFSKDVESLNQPRDNVPSPRSTSLIVEEAELDLMVATKSVPPPGRVSSPRVWSLGRQAGRQATPTQLLPISILKGQLLHHKEAAWSRIKDSLLRECKLPTKQKP
jgi:hypothetical protein